MYISITFNYINNCRIYKYDSLSRAWIILYLYDEPYQLWLRYEYFGNWIYKNIDEDSIVTEKNNALIKLYIMNNSHCRKELTSILPYISSYNITKFMYLTHIVNQSLIHDLLHVIINLSD